MALLRSDSRLRLDISEAFLIAPPFPLEHLEHGDVLLVERVALDDLKMLRFKTPLARNGDLFLRKPLFSFAISSF
ncbi:MAG: hypothetical protein K2Y71_23385 [Xanthobacteraceae bacterium]|nr:hypothetical protein [Xanthobacteraceae bacterium]